MSSEPKEAAAPVRRSGWTRRIVLFVIVFAISLAIGKGFELAGEPETIEAAKAAQQEWIEAVSRTSPIALGGTYWHELNGAMAGESEDGAWAAQYGKFGILSPVVAFGTTVMRLYEDSGAVIIISQLVLGALALAVFNFMVSDGESILFNDLMANLVIAPILVILLASLIGLVLWGIMMGALILLGWATAFAAWAVGATGVAAFCLYCFGELGKKGAEHILTGRLK